MSQVPSITSDKLYKAILEQYSNISELLRNSYQDSSIESVVQKLNEIIKFSELEITKSCRNQFEVLLASISELEKLKKEVHDFKLSFSSYSTGANSLFNEYCDCVKELQNVRVIQKNVALTLDFLIKCLPIFSLHTTLEQKITKDSYLEILETCDFIDTMSKDSIKQIPYIKAIFDKVPLIRNSVKEHAKQELLNFMDSTFENLKGIGQSVWATAIKKLSIKLTNAESMRYNSVPEISPLENIDFSPVYWYNYVVQNSTDKTEDEMKFYMNERTRQSVLLFKWSTKANKVEDLDLVFETCLYPIIGLFAVENLLIMTTKNLITKNYLDEVYENIKSVILSTLSVIYVDLESFKKSKTIKSVIYRFDKITELLNIRTNLMRDSLKVFSQVFFRLMGEQLINYEPDASNNEPFIVLQFQTPEDEKGLLGPFANTLKSTYPKTLRMPTYTNGLIVMYVNATGNERETLISATDASDSLSSSSPSVNFDSLVGFFDIALKKLSGLLGSSSSIENMINLFWNISFVGTYFHDLVHSKYYGDKEHQIQITDFNKSAKELVEKIEENIKDYVLDSIYDTFMSLKPNLFPTNVDCVGYDGLEALINILRNVFNSLLQYPEPNVFDLINLAAKKVAQNMLEFLALPQNTSYSKEFLHEYNFNVTLLEKLFLELKIEDYDFIKHYFLPCKQSLHLILKEDWTPYFDNFGLSFSPYSQVDPKILSKIVYRLIASESAKKIGSSISKWFKKDKSTTMSLRDVLATLNKLNI